MKLRYYRVLSETDICIIDTVFPLSSFLRSLSHETYQEECVDKTAEIEEKQTKNSKSIEKCTENCYT